MFDPLAVYAVVTPGGVLVATEVTERAVTVMRGGVAYVLWWDDQRDQPSPVLVPAGGNGEKIGIDCVRVVWRAPDTPAHWSFGPPPVPHHQEPGWEEVLRWYSELCDDVRQARPYLQALPRGPPKYFDSRLLAEIEPLVRPRAEAAVRDNVSIELTRLCGRVLLRLACFPGAGARASGRAE